MGGARAAVPGAGPVAGDLCRSARPQDGPSQRGTAAGGIQDDQHQRRRGERADSCAAVALDGGAKTPPGTLGPTTRLVRERRMRIPRTSLKYERTAGFWATGLLPQLRLDDAGPALGQAGPAAEPVVQE